MVLNAWVIETKLAPAPSSTRLQPSVAVATALGTVPVAVQPLQTEWPESPVPHPPAFRGPPRSFFA